MMENIPNAEIGIIEEVVVPMKATKLVIDVAIMALEAFLKVNATLLSKSSLTITYYPE